MAEKQVTINELAAWMICELRRIGYSEEPIWRHYHPRIRSVVNYYERVGITYYSPKVTDELIELNEERHKRRDIRYSFKTD